MKQYAIDRYKVTLLQKDLKHLATSKKGGCQGTQATGTRKKPKKTVGNVVAVADRRGPSETVGDRRGP